MSASALASTLMASTLMHEGHGLHPRTRRTSRRLYGMLAEGSHPTHGIFRDEALREFLTRNAEDGEEEAEMAFDFLIDSGAIEHLPGSTTVQYRLSTTTATSLLPSASAGRRGRRVLANPPSGSIKRKENVGVWNAGGVVSRLGGSCWIGAARTSSPHLTSPHLASPHLTSPHLTSPHHTSPHLAAGLVPRQGRRATD